MHLRQSTLAPFLSASAFLALFAISLRFTFTKFHFNGPGSHSLPQDPSSLRAKRLPPALLTKLAALGPLVQQAHGDVPASSSVYCSMAGLLAFQIFPGDVRVGCLHHCHRIIPYGKDAPQTTINITGASQSICFQQLPLSS